MAQHDKGAFTGERESNRKRHNGRDKEMNTSAGKGYLPELLEKTKEGKRAFDIRFFSNFSRRRRRARSRGGGGEDRQRGLEEDAPAIH